jgi:hypothetical protein
VTFHAPCPKCRKTDYLRFERVIRANDQTDAYYCGRCDFEWTVVKKPTSPEPRDLSPLPSPRLDGIEPGWRK